MASKGNQSKAPERNKSGATVTLMAAAFMIILTFIGFFCAELVHVSVVRRQLRNACDAAGLATAAALASSSYPSLLANTKKIGGATVTPRELEVARQNAADIGLQIFRKNTVCGRLLKESARVDDAFAISPAEGKTLVTVNFYRTKPNGDLRNIDAIRGKHVVYSASTNVAPLFGISIFGPQVVVQAAGRSASAVIDLAFCLDNSDSMAVDTIQYAVQRTWLNGSIQYLNPVPAGSGNPINPSKKLGAKWKGGAPVYPTQVTTTKNGLFFNAALHGRSNRYSFPGNKDQQIVVNATDFTDNVVMPSGFDDENQLGTIPLPGDPLGTLVDGFNSRRPIHFEHEGQSYSFPNVATMVEAMRGNLDDPGNEFYVKNLKVAPFNMIAKPGYQAAYEAYAVANTEPFHSECVQVSNFFALLHANTDTHFCLIPFSAKAGTNEPGTIKQHPVGRGYEPTVGEPERAFPFKQVELNKVDDHSSELDSAINAYHLYGGTATGAGLTEAARNLIETGQTRIGARKVVILLSDGQPTDADGISYDKAQTLGRNGVPVFSIAFLHGKSEAQEDAFGFMNSISESCRDAGGVGSTAFTISDQNMSRLQLMLRQLAHEIVTLE